MRAPLRLSICLLLASGVTGASGPETFRFWPGEGVEKVAGFQRMNDHPCGQVAHATVSRLPTAKNGPLESEVVVELNGSGKVIRRWPMPVDYTPRAVRGEEMLAVAGETGFWIRANGSFRRADQVPAPSDRRGFKCDLTSVFGKSDYAGCSIFVDLLSGKERTLGYQGVCT